MQTRAAVAWQAGEPLAIETIEIEGPKAGEVLVEIKATGICHTDAYTLSGADPEGLFPAILGHEGAGIVREIGSGVTSLKPGDHVIPLYTPECRQCKTCLSRRSNLCTAIRATQGKGVMPDGTSRFRCDGDPVFHYMGCSTFSNVTVLPEIALAKVREDAPFDKICYIGCGVTTGVGAVINTAKVWPGANVAVFGLGGIGLNVIQGARMVGADKIVGVDTNPAKRAMAEKFGMTHFVNPDEVGRDKVVQAILDLTGGGADFRLSASATSAPCGRRWNAATAAGARASSSAWPEPARKSPRGRFSWSRVACGAARRSAARAGARTFPKSSTGTWRERSTSTI
jgi:S-(hydroxymethyl)glutathione dehydrogenase / alcohol dehydrogenase